MTRVSEISASVPRRRGRCRPCFSGGITSEGTRFHLGASRRHGSQESPKNGERGTTKRESSAGLFGIDLGESTGPTPTEGWVVLVSPVVTKSHSPGDNGFILTALNSRDVKITTMVGEITVEEKRSGGRSRELVVKSRSLGRVLGFPLVPAGLLTAPALDLACIECSSHRGLRSLLR